MFVSQNAYRGVSVQNGRNLMPFISFQTFPHSFKMSRPEGHTQPQIRVTRILKHVHTQTVLV